MITALNPREAATLPDAPHKADGSLYRFEIILPGARTRGYADTHDELLELLSPGYLASSGPRARMIARLHLAMTAQVHIQALLTDFDRLERCSPDQREVILASRATPPAPTGWSAPIPLVLVTTFYEPVGRIPKPLAEDESEIWWIDPSSAKSLLTDLADIGWINLAEAVDAEEDDRG